MIMAQLAFFGMHTTDTIVAGRLGPEVLAGVALGGILMMVGFTFLIGFGFAVAPGVAQRFGAQAPAAEISQFVVSALAFSVAIWSLWGLLLWTLPPLLLARLPLEPLVADEALAYIRAAAIGTPFIGAFFVLRNALEGLGHSRPVMWLGLAALLLNLPLDIVLMHGWGPIPALGAMGCGLATSLVQALLATTMAILFARHRRYRAYAPRGRPQMAGVREVWWVGLPLGLALMSEHAIFAAGGLFMTRYGTAEVAANHIAFNVTGLAFMLALGWGQATAVMVGQAVGRGDRAAVRMAGALGYRVCAVVACGLAILLIVGADAVSRLYTRDPAVAAVAASFVRIAGAFHVFDALQALGAGALRGLKDTAYVLRATILAYWVIGGLAYYVLIVRGAGSAQSIWWIFTLALGAAAGLLAWRFFSQTRLLPGSPGPSQPNLPEAS